ncbi:MAG: class II aldolase/adducin family protein [Candidatus Thermoplasmatota archaeon]
MIKFSQYLDEKKLLDEGLGSISIDSGNRILINGEGINLTRLTKEGVLEIIDYDPIKNIILAIGKIEPCIQTPIHWMIQRARHDVHAVVILESKKLLEYPVIKETPITERDYQEGSLDLVKEVLKTLRTGRIIRIMDREVLLVGMSLREITSMLNDIIKK